MDVLPDSRLLSTFMSGTSSYLDYLCLVYLDNLGLSRGKLKKFHRYPCGDRQNLNRFLSDIRFFGYLSCKARETCYSIGRTINVERYRMMNWRPYLRSAQKIVWDSTFGKILGGPERKTKFFETRRKWRFLVGSASGARRTPLPLNLIRHWPWPIGQGKP